MTNAEAVRVQLLKGKEGLTLVELMAATGLGYQQVHSALACLQRRVDITVLKVRGAVHRWRIIREDKRAPAPEAPNVYTPQGLAFVCPSLGPTLLDTCLTSYTEANAKPALESPCFRCVLGRTKRAQFARGR